MGDSLLVRIGSSVPRDVLLKAAELFLLADALILAMGYTSVSWHPQGAYRSLVSCGLYSGWFAHKSFLVQFGLADIILFTCLVIGVGIVPESRPRAYAFFLVPFVIHLLVAIVVFIQVARAMAELVHVQLTCEQVLYRDDSLMNKSVDDSGYHTNTFLFSNYGVLAWGVMVPVFCVTLFSSAICIRWKTKEAKTAPEAV